jgi:hypothetical protein
MNPSHRQMISEHHFFLSTFITQFRSYFLIGGVILAAGIGLIAWDFSDEEVETFWPGVVVLSVGLLWLIPSAVSYAQSIKKVTVYEEGIAWVVGRQEEYRPWDEVREVYRSEPSSNRNLRQSELNIVFKKKQSVMFSQSLSDFFQLATLVEAIVTERLLPEYRTALDQGKAQFGPVSFSRQSIHINGCEFPWNEVEEYAICNGGIVVTPVDYEDFTGEHVAFSEIPNYLILLKLLEETGQRQTPAATCILLHGRS